MRVNDLQIGLQIGLQIRLQIRLQIEARVEPGAASDPRAGQRGEAASQCGWRPRADRSTSCTTASHAIPA
jgi:hypothetical protein